MDCQVHTVGKAIRPIFTDPFNVITVANKLINGKVNENFKKTELNLIQI